MTVDAHLLVPLKRLDQAKSRLAAALAPEERAALMRSLLNGVLDAVCALGHPVTVVSSEPIDVPVPVWHDRGLEWNEALATAMRELVSAEVAAVVSADLPFC